MWMWRVMLWLTSKITMDAVILSHELFHYSPSVEDLSPDDIITTVSLRLSVINQQWAMQYYVNQIRITPWIFTYYIIIMIWLSGNESGTGPSSTKPYYFHTGFFPEIWPTIDRIQIQIKTFSTLNIRCWRIFAALAVLCAFQGSCSFILQSAISSLIWNKNLGKNFVAAS